MKTTHQLGALALGAWMLWGGAAGAYLGTTEDHLTGMYGSPVAGPTGWQAYIVESEMNPGVLSELRVRMKDQKVVEAIATHIEPKPAGALHIDKVPLRIREHLAEIGLSIKAAGGKLAGRFHRYRELYYVYQLPNGSPYGSIRADYTLTETDANVTYRYRIRYILEPANYAITHLPEPLTPMSRQDDPLDLLLKGQ